MHKLTILKPDLTVLDYSGNPWHDTLPALVDMLSEVIGAVQSYGTILSSIHNAGCYARAYLDQFGLPVVVVITPFAS